MGKKLDLETMVSIIIPVYNCEKYIREAIQSALDQTYGNTEIVVVDDGSTDKTRDIILEFNDITTIFKVNGGTASALNAGIRAGSGKWIKWLSADDVLYKDAVSEMMKRVLDRYTIHYTHYDYIDENGDVTGEFVEHDRRESELWKYFYGNGSSSLIHEDLFRLVGLFDESLRHSEDYEFWLRATQVYGCRLSLLNMKSVKYRRHPDQITHKIGGSNDSLIKNKIKKLCESKPVIGEVFPKV